MLAAKLREAAEQKLSEGRELFRINLKLEVTTSVDKLIGLRRELQAYEAEFDGRERHWLRTTERAQQLKAAISDESESLTVQELDAMSDWCKAGVFAAEQFLRPFRAAKAERERIAAEKEKECVTAREAARLKDEPGRHARREFQEQRLREKQAQRFVHEYQSRPRRWYKEQKKLKQQTR